VELLQRKVPQRLPEDDAAVLFTKQAFQQLSASPKLHLQFTPPALPDGRLSARLLPTQQTWRSGMKSKVFLWLAQMAVVALAFNSGLVAQDSRPVELRGTISDYTAPGAQTWEMRGVWSLKLHGYSGTADFTAALNMEHSDLALINGTTARSQHTHHITLKGGTVISDQTYVATNCPSAHYGPPTTTGFAVVGAASITGNGGFAPFAPHGELSQLTVCVTGSDQVEFSNLTLVLASPASGHFGTQPINGVVHAVKSHDDDK
jgi:hypothetical protein